MPLTNKYLKYSPEITLEIFTLIWNKLIENGCKFEYSKEIIFERFKFHDRVLRYDSNGNYVYPLTGNNSCKETTVQEILGYDPFTKEEVVPEYVECISVATCNTKVGEIFKCRHSDGYFEWEYNNKSMKEYNSWDGWGVPWSDKLPQKHFKPSTKEAFDVQNKPIEKWSVGSYFVIEKDRLYNISSSKRGDICIIKEDKTFNFINKKDQINWSFDFREGSRWFATKAEAEEFAKTLVESVKEKVKQPLKQAVYCETQEEWDFACDKYDKEKRVKTEFGKEYNTFSYTSNFKGWKTKEYYIKENYQILSFQEWCDLNGYKMESNQEFKVGDWVVNLNASMNYKINEICKISLIEDGKIACESKPQERSNQKDFKYFRYATPEEINNHLISIGQIPAGEQLSTGIEPNKDGIFKYKSTTEGFRVGSTIDNHLEIMVKSTVKPTIEFNYLPEPN